LETTCEQHRLEQALAKASASITRLIKAYQKELISLDELRSRETSLRTQLDALAAQLVDREAYLKLAENLEGFLTRLRGNSATATRARTAARAAPAHQRRPHRT
jgi:site-specific DNA recombinase